MLKELIQKVMGKTTPVSGPANAVLKKMKVDASIVVRRRDGTLKSRRELEDNKEVLKEDY